MPLPASSSSAGGLRDFPFLSEPRINKFGKSKNHKLSGENFSGKSLLSNPMPGRNDTRSVTEESPEHFESDHRAAKLESILHDWRIGLQ